MLYRDVFKDGNTYEHGDCCTFGGHVWHANQDTTEKPGTSKAWTMMVRRGRDGKDGRDGKPGERGPIGPAGKAYEP
jgi:integrin beta 3